jgi:hypothetical protein
VPTARRFWQWTQRAPSQRCILVSQSEPVVGTGSGGDRKDPQGQLLADEARAQMEMQNATRRDEISKLLHDYFNETKPEAKTAFRKRIDGLAMAHLAFNIGYKRDEIELLLRQQRELLAGRRVRKKGWSKDDCERAIAGLKDELDALVEKEKRLRELEHKPERPFFLWHLWFRHILKAPPNGRGGFDIFIANPPYISHDRIPAKEKSEYQKKFCTFEPFADIYCYFIELSAQLLKPNGISVFITSNSYIKADYGRHLRKLLGASHHIIGLVNIEDTQVFSSAIVNTAILIFKNASCKAADTTTVVNASLTIPDIQAHVAIFGKQIPSHYLNSIFWVLEDAAVLDVKAKIERVGRQLEEIGAKIRLGIATGHNEAFVIDETSSTRAGYWSL